MPRIIIVFLLGSVLIIDGCQRKDFHEIVRRNLQAPRSYPQVLAVYQPWFGGPGHIDVGYSSQDPEVLHRQIEQARSMGISGFVVDWYGDRSPFVDRSFSILQRVARESRFQVALMYDETEDDNGQATEDALAAMTKAYKAYIGPEAPDRESYLTYQGRPVVFVFPKRGRTDWSRVRQMVNAWPSPPLLIYKDQPPAEFASTFDGSYAWIQPGNNRWAPDGSDWGETYLNHFYKSMQKDHSNKIAVGAAWPGFDDSRAGWGLNRKMDSRGGRTLSDTMELPRKYYDESNPLPFLLIETWNDYEEGTAIEPKSGGTHAGRFVGSVQ